MRRATIPTLLALFILVVCLVSIVVIIKGPQFLESGANASVESHDIRITNVTDTSITVSWTTDKPTIGFVRYTRNGQSINTPPSSVALNHFVLIQGLVPSASYTVEVNSDGQFADPKQVVTLPSYTPSSKIISGQILDNKNLPARDVLVYVGVEGVTKYSALTGATGNWIISLPEISDTTILSIFATGMGQETRATIDLENANPMPTMVLGRTYDFRNNETKQTSDVPQLEIKLPEQK